MKPSEPNCSCWVLPVICRSLNMLEKVVGSSVGKLRQRLGCMLWPELTTETQASQHHFFLIWSGRPSTHISLYLTNKAVVCMFAVLGFFFKRNNLWTENFVYSTLLTDNNFRFYQEVVCQLAHHFGQHHEILGKYDEPPTLLSSSKHLWFWVK